MTVLGPALAHEPVVVQVAPGVGAEVPLVESMDA